jgi:VWFA-related protein
VAHSRLSYIMAFILGLVLQIKVGSTVAQTNPKEIQESQVIKVKTELMELRTVVLDRSGRIVEDLKKEDFELYEDDKPQDISFFSVSKLGREQIKHSEALLDGVKKSDLHQETLVPPNQSPARNILLYVDTLHLSNSSLNRVKDALRRFISDRITDQDMAAIAASGQSLGIAQQFTRDKKLLNYAIEQIRLGPVELDKSFTPLLAAGVLANRLDDSRLAIDIVRRDQGITDCCMLRTLARNRSLQILSEKAFYRKSTVSTLRDFAEQLTRWPGKRMIVIFSDGFTLYDNDSDTHPDQLRPIIDLAARSGVAIYAIDAKGLQVSPVFDAGKNNSSSAPDSVETSCNGAHEPRCEAPDPGQISTILSSSEREELNGLSQIAQETGGKLFSETNNLERPLGEALDANRYYYLLAYYLQASDNDRKFRKIKVRIRNHPEYAVQTARGFSPSAIRTKSPDEADISPHRRLLEAINVGTPLNQLNVSAQADYTIDEADDKNVTLTIDFDGTKSADKGKDQAANFGVEIITYIYDANAKQVEAIAATVQGKLTPERVAQAQNSGYRFSRRLTLKPGVYQARIGIREDGTDRIGTATAWVQVSEPKNQELDVSNIVLRNPLGEDAARKEDIHLSDLEQIKIVQGIPFYGHDIFCEYSFRIHPGTREPRESEIKFMRELLKGGRPIKSEPWLPIFEDEKQAANNGWFEIHDDMDLSSLDPGIYELRVTVKDTKSNQTVQRTAVFGVE